MAKQRYAVVEAATGKLLNIIVGDDRIPPKPGPGETIRLEDPARDSLTREPDRRELADELVRVQSEIDSASKHAAVPEVSERLAMLRTRLAEIQAEMEKAT